MADILPTAFTLNDQFPLTRGIGFFNESTGEWERASNAKEYYERLGLLITDGDLSTANFLQSEDVSDQDTSPDDIFLSPDGSKMFISGVTDVYEYNLVIPFNLASKSFVQSFDTSTQETTCNSVTFNNDGTKMYICGDSSNSVHEYDLSGAFSLTSVVFNQSLNVSAVENFPRGMTFNNDGSKMYIVGPITDSVNEFDLSTDYDISTAVFLQALNISAQEITVTSVVFSDQGDQMYICGTGSDSVHSYSLTTFFDVSTASFRNSFSVASQETAPNGMHINIELTKMYVIGGVSDAVNEYDLSTGVSIPSFLNQTDNRYVAKSITGTFVPTLFINGVTTGITYTFRSGNYTRIDDLVYFNIYIALSSKGAENGNIRLEGLPFNAQTPHPGTGNLQYAYRASWYTNVSDFTAVITDDEPITLLFYGAGSGSQQLSSVWNNNTQVRLSGFYKTDEAMLPLSQNVPIGGITGLGPSTEYTIASGAITITGSNVIVDTEGDAPTDDLDNINGGFDGAIIVVSQQNGSRDVTVKDATGNLRMPSDFILANPRSKIIFIKRGLNWEEISRSTN